MVKSKSVTPETEKIKNILLKIKELADRGEEHERNVAHNKLEFLLKKYKLSYSDLISNKPQHRRFEIDDKNDCLRLLSQCIWGVCIGTEINYKGKFVYVSPITTEQFIEINEKFNYYWDEYKKQREVFFIAFISKNNLGVESCKGKKIDNDKVLKVANMMRGMEKSNYKTKNKLLK